MLDRTRRTTHCIFQWTKDMDARLLALVEDKLTFLEVAELVGVSKSAVSRRLRKLGIAASQPVWSGQQIEQLREMIANGHTARQVAPIVGKSRNAVLAKMDRLGLESRRPVRVKTHAPRPKRGFHIPTERVAPRDTAGRMEYKRKINSGEIKPREALSPALLADTFTPPELRKPLLDLGTAECRWPYGESNFTFCARPAVGSYCGFHSLVHRYGTQAATSLYCEDMG